MQESQSNDSQTAAPFAAFHQLSRLAGVAADDQAPVNPVEAQSSILASFVGFGIDSNFVSASNDATTACGKAVTEALDRSAITLRMLQQNIGSQSDLQIYVKLGVPLKVSVTRDGPRETMTVDSERIQQLLPADLPLAPFDIVIGGLAVPEANLCTSAVLLSIFRGSPTALTTRHSPIMPPLTWEQVEQQAQTRHTEDSSLARGATMETAPSPHVHRSTSIEMLARISSQIHETELPNSKADDASSSYRKPPPIAVTNEKLTKRLLVRHEYIDYASELPQHGELEHIIADGIHSTPTFSTTNWAFPLKLHETLHQIEVEGKGHVIGWLPHGRSFKIFKQEEFADVVLPRYFVMTKKSSFLRQLNLYGFKRLCRIGPNQGSYYHPLFLRGRKFLAKRMQREKVNGNGIRTAGNPTEEPNLGSYPPLPKTHAADAVTSAVIAVGKIGINAPEEPYKATARVDVASPDLDAVHATFPLRLQRILDKLDADEDTDIVSWLPHGRAFIVRDTNRFVDELMPMYFNQSKYSSFQRQLHMYGYRRITSNGPDKGAYHNPSFLRGQPGLAFAMRRTRINGKGTRKPGDPESEPDFYKLDPLPPIAKGARILIPLERHQRLPGDQSVDDGDECCSLESGFGSPIED